MDFDALVSEIVSRVSAKLEEHTSGFPSESNVVAAKPKLLILTQEHSEPCHAMLESPALLAHYSMTCALLNDYQVDIEDYDGVLLYSLTNETLCKLASGICDSPFTRLAVKAILCGKKIWIPTEEVELFRYCQCAPACYYEMLHEKLELLTKSGACICAQGNLEHVVLNGFGSSAPEKNASCATAVPNLMATPKRYRIDKRVITERDVLEVQKAGITKISVPQRAILTDLAKDSVRTLKLEILRD